MGVRGAALIGRKWILLDTSMSMLCKLATEQLRESLPSSSPSEPEFLFSIVKILFCLIHFGDVSNFLLFGKYSLTLDDAGDALALRLELLALRLALLGPVRDAQHFLVFVRADNVHGK